MPECDGVQTEYGMTAIDPTAGTIDACPETVVTCEPQPIITTTELARHPRGCSVSTPAQVAMAEAIIMAVTAKIEDFYGYSLTPCCGVRVFRLNCHRARIDPILRVDKVEIGGCDCSVCNPTYTEVDLCDVVVGSEDQMAPWDRLRLCEDAGCGGSLLRVSGVWGAQYPIHPGIKAVAIQVTAKLLQSYMSGYEIIANNEDGSTRYSVPDFSLDELSLLPRHLRRYEGMAV